MKNMGRFFRGWFGKSVGGSIVNLMRPTKDGVRHAVLMAIAASTVAVTAKPSKAPYEHPSSSPPNKTSGVDTDYILDIPARIRCKPILSELEKVVLDVDYGGPDCEFARSFWKYVSDCPNIPPSVAQIGERMAADTRS